MQFKVPQFIDIEDKLFGPLTFKQFAYLAGGGGMIYVLYKLLPFFIAIILIVPVGLFALALAFYKINEKPFLYYLQAGITYATKSKLYVWRQKFKKVEAKDEAEVEKVSYIPNVSSNRIRDLSWSLDVLDKNKDK